MIRPKTLIKFMLTDRKQHLINITGLTIGLTVLLLVSLYLKTELSFDKHVSDHEHKYRLLQQLRGEKEAIFPYSAGKLLQSGIPELQTLCMIDGIYGNFTKDNTPFKLENAFASDSSFVSLFDLTIVDGAKNNLLNTPSTCILSESTAHKLFGDTPPIGKTIERANDGPLTIEAVFKDFPSTSHLKADIVESRSTWLSMPDRKRYFNAWGYQSTNIYVALNKNTSPERVQKKLTQQIIERSPWFKKHSLEESLSMYSVRLQKLDDIHLSSTDILWDEYAIRNNPNTLKAFALVMVLVILMASFNYINLSTAASEKKGKASGILKSMGASQTEIFTFFFVQTCIIGFIAIFLSYLLTGLLLPYFQQILEIQLHFVSLFEAKTLLTITSVIALIIFMSGIYPAIFFSKSPAISILSNSRKNQSKKKTISLRSALVTLQFVMSIFLIVALLGIQKQIKLVTSGNLGFNKDQLLEIRYNRDKKDFAYFNQEIEKLASIESVTAASNMPCEYINNQNTLQLVDKKIENPPSGCVVGVEPDYFKTMGTKLLQGRWFSADYGSEGGNVLVNETTLKALDISNPIGKRISLKKKEYTIVGVVEDVQYRTLHESALPVIYSTNFDNYQKIAIRLNQGNHVETLEKIKSFWNSNYPEQFFESKFFDSKLQANYTSEVKQTKLFNILVAIGLSVLTLGLIGLVKFLSEKKTKEIGVRKVNGAKVSEILTMLNKDFIVWVAIAFVIATPIAYYSMYKWLENFAYKTELSWWVFALAGGLALGIALLTVTWQSWRAASRNPVEALRYE